MLYQSFLLFSCFLTLAIAPISIGNSQESTGKLPAPASPPLKTLEEQAAYAIGLEIGEEALANEPDLNPEIIARGLIDAMKKAKPALSEDKAQEAMSQYMAKKLGPGAEKNLKEGKEFLATNKAKQGVITTDSGLQYFVIKSGTGRTPKPTDVVRVHYNGMLLDGKVFDTTIGKDAAEIPVNRVIPGWTEALLKMKVGDKWRLYIPSQLAYGAQGPPGGPIPPFATLIFDVELLDIVQ
ncbi:MAG TPA: FKBP-type peptidyl-prolyl cis-trans isomerase [Pirellulaceae bacterium]|jgi:FKBP-type peptidyl-prolyl cis-trans isomerase